MIQTHHQLFGPVAHYGAIRDHAVGTQWVFPGSALTAATKRFRFSRGLQSVNSAVWLLMWVTPNRSHKARLVYFDDGPSNVVEICEVTGTGEGQPRVNSFDLTGLFNKLVAERIDKNIGWQLKDDGNTAAEVFESRLEIVW